MKSPQGHWRPVPAQPGARTEEGLAVYRFGTSLYFANAGKLMQDVAAQAGHGSPLRWMVLDCAAIGDVDFTAPTALAKVIEQVRGHHVRLVLSSVLDPGAGNSTVTASARPWGKMPASTPPAKPARPFRSAAG
jgi:MFS superfamily sulfate permease-like transporter